MLALAEVGCRRPAAPPCPSVPVPCHTTTTLPYGISATGAGGRAPNLGIEWDAENRLTAIVQGTRRSEFTYNGARQRVRIVEKDGATGLSDQRYLWCGLSICEQRDAAGASVTRRFFGPGMQEGSSNHFYTPDHLQSIREMTDSIGVVRARYEYNPYGGQTRVSGDKEALFGFTGHLVHNPSGLIEAPYRAYSASLGRWISEDPIGLAGGANLYAYVSNEPVTAHDPTGEMAQAAAAPFLAGLGPPGWVALGVVTVAALWWMTQHPPQIPQVPPSTGTGGSSTGTGGGGTGTAGGGATTTSGGGGATTTTMTPPSTGVPPFPIPPNDPCEIKGVKCSGLLQACLKGFMTGPCWSCAQMCEATKNWPYHICHGNGK